jgi:hypothetical protein
MGMAAQSKPSRVKIRPRLTDSISAWFRARFISERELQRPGRGCSCAGGVGMRAANHANRFRPGIRTKTCGTS